MIKVWLDDIRPMPAGYDVHCVDAASCIELLSRGCVSMISFDHDLGETGGTGYDVACWIEKAVASGTIAMPDWHIHSANPVGARNIELAMRSTERFSQR